MRAENGFQKIGKERIDRHIWISTLLIQRAKDLGLWKDRHYSDLVNIALDAYLAKITGGLNG
jgi:hypothetical protein